MPLELHALLGGDPLVKSGPPYTFGQLAQAMAAPDLPVTAYTLALRQPQPLRNVRLVEAVPPFTLFRRMPMRYLGPFGTRRNVAQLVRAVRKAPGKACVWTFGGVPLELMKILHGEGVPVVREKYNCAQRTARDILTHAYRELGLEPPISITDESIKIEEESLALASAVFCPSPHVAASLRSIGLEDNRLIDTSYGWDPARFPRSDQPVPRTRDAGPTVLFLGYACVRKGAHTLLEAWRRANIDGRLVFVGDLEPMIAERYADHLAMPTVERVGFTHDIGALLRGADWMAFPTLEEGSPLVSYEAIGNGLPLITTPMGAGSIIRDGIEGIVLNNATVDDWTEQFRSLPDRRAERDRLSVRARARSIEYTWNLVGQRRRNQLLTRLGDEP